jgi:hypothetical protein
MPFKKKDIFWISGSYYFLWTKLIWSTDFVISKKICNFLDELGLFIEEKPICTKKKFPSPAVCPEKFGSPLLPFPGSSHTKFWLLFHFLVKYWPISMFLGLIWCKILCWAQKSILYGVKSPKAFGAQKRNLLVMIFL